MVGRFSGAEDQFSGCGTMANQNGILLVEDSEDDVFLFRRAWSQAGAKIPLTCLGDAGKAMQFLLEAASTPQDGMPELVLTDLKMPGPSGFDLLRFTREQAVLAELPILVWSNSTDPSDVEEAASLGAHCYFPKPTGKDGWERLVQRVREFYDELLVTQR